MLGRLSAGDVYDMCVERANDHEQYPYKATRDDVIRFFGG